MPDHDHDALAGVAEELQAAPDQGVADPLPLPRRHDRYRREGDGRGRIDVHAGEEDVAGDLVVDLGDQGQEDVAGGAKLVDEVGFVGLSEGGFNDRVDGGMVGVGLGADLHG